MDELRQRPRRVGRHWIWDSHEAVLEACGVAWNKLVETPERIASITERPRAKTVTKRAAGTGLAQSLWKHALKDTITPHDQMERCSNNVSSDKRVDRPLTGDVQRGGELF